jgi:hypothetical protein
MGKVFFITMIGSLALLFFPYANADEIDAARTDTYTVLDRGAGEIKIDAEFDDWRLSENVLLMGKDTWEPWQGGTWDDKDDLSAELYIAYDEDNLYFALLVKDDEYVAEGANPWSNDGVQIAIDSSEGKIPAGWPNATTHLYNFSINDGWQRETGPFLGDAEIEMRRDEDTKQTFFEWRMPGEIIGGRGAEFKAGMEMAFAIIVNDSDQNAKGQTGWVGWGNHTIVHGKNPEEMKTIVLSPKTMAVNARGKLTSTWANMKR